MAGPEQGALNGADIELLVRYDSSRRCEVLDAALVSEWGGGVEGDDLQGIMDVAIDWWMSAAGPRRPLTVRSLDGSESVIDPPPAPVQVPATVEAGPVMCTTCHTLVLPREGRCPKCGVSFSHKVAPPSTRQGIAFDTRLLTWRGKVLLVCCGLLTFIVGAAAVVFALASGATAIPGAKLMGLLLTIPAAGIYWVSWRFLDKRGVKLRR